MNATGNPGLDRAVVVQTKSPEVSMQPEPLIARETRSLPRRQASEGLAGIVAVVACAAIIVAGLSYLYVSSQAPAPSIGVIGEATTPN